MPAAGNVTDIRSTVIRATVFSSEFSTRASRTTLTARATGSSARDADDRAELIAQRAQGQRVQPPGPGLRARRPPCGGLIGSAASTVPSRPVSTRSAALPRVTCSRVSPE